MPAPFRLVVKSQVTLDLLHTQEDAPPDILQLYGVDPVVQVELGHEMLALTERVTQLLHPMWAWLSQ